MRPRFSVGAPAVFPLRLFVVLGCALSAFPVSAAAAPNSSLERCKALAKALDPATARHADADWREAIAGCRKAVEEQTASAEAHDLYGRLMADVHDEMGFDSAEKVGSDLKQAVQHLQNAVALSPKTARYHVDLAKAFSYSYQDKNCAANAVEEVRKALQLEPKQVQWWLTLGRYQDFGTDHAGARESFREAVRLAPTSAVARNQLAFSLVAYQHEEEALREFQETLKIDPANADALRMKAELTERLAKKAALAATPQPAAPKAAPGKVAVAAVPPTSGASAARAVSSTESRTVLLPIIETPIRLSAAASRWRLPEKDEGTGLRATLSNGDELSVNFGLDARGCPDFIDAVIKGGTEQDPKNPPVALSKPSYLPDSWYGRVARDKSLTSDSACLVTANRVYTAGIDVDWDQLAKGAKPSVDEANVLLRALLESVAAALGVGAPAKPQLTAQLYPAKVMQLPVSGLSVSFPKGDIDWEVKKGTAANRDVDLITQTDSSGDNISIYLDRLKGRATDCKVVMADAQTSGKKVIPIYFAADTGWYAFAQLVDNGVMLLCHTNPDGIYSAVLAGDAAEFPSVKPLLQSLDSAIERYYAESVPPPAQDTRMYLGGIRLNILLPGAAGVWRENQSNQYDVLVYSNPVPGRPSSVVSLGEMRTDPATSCDEILANWRKNGWQGVDVTPLLLGYADIMYGPASPGGRPASMSFCTSGRSGVPMLVSLIAPEAAPDKVKMVLDAIMLAIKAE